MSEVPDNDGETTEIATGTLAEIYAQQGLVERALEIYRRIARRAPDDERVASRIRELTRELEAANGPSLSSEDEPTAGDPQGGAEASDEPAAAPDPSEVPIAPPQEPAIPLAYPREDAEFLAWLERL